MNKKIFQCNFLLILSAFFIWINSSTLALSIGTTAKSALVFDHETNDVILEKNADMPLPPASMSKLMTLNMIFEALRQGQITLEDEQKGGNSFVLSNQCSIDRYYRVAERVRYFKKK